jgi:alkylation response protein AidB-like acyl-CoA dehydrogenase
MWKLTDEQQMIQKTVREWAAAKLAPVAEKYEHEKVFPVHLYKEFAALGFPGIRYPEAIGGGGGGILDMCIWVKELAKVLPGFAISSSVACGLGAKMLSYGTPEQQQKYLLPTVEGEMIGAFGLTEPNAGSDATNLLMNGSSMVQRPSSPTAALLIISWFRPVPTARKNPVSAFLLCPKTPPA